MMTKSPMSKLQPPGARSNRTTQRRRHRRRVVFVFILVLALIGAATGAATFLLASRGDATDTASRIESPPPAQSSLAVLAVRGDPALAVVVGSGGDQPPAVVSLPSEMTFTVPGQGDGTVDEAIALEGSSFRVAVSNLLGVWVDHFAVMDRDGLGALVDRMGGIGVDLQEAFETEEETLGPGEVRLTGEQVDEYLNVHGRATELRWQLVLQGLLAKRALLLQSDLEETDDATAVADILGDAKGSAVQQVPVEDLGGDLQDPLIKADPEELPGFVSAAFGEGRGETVPVIVVNGNGEPGVGESVAAKIVPEGFRVVLSQNADRFDHDTTAVIASGDEHLDAARRVQEALGVGEVQVTRVPSGLADVTIVVGKDYGRG
jgi:LytR cell envelope-related transcriptional attenuator/LytR_cpsA_psr family